VDATRFLELFQSESPTRLLADYDLLVVEGHANRSEIGRAAIAGTEHAGMTFQNHLFRIRPHSIVDPEFLLLALNSRFARRHWSAVSNTSSGLNTINRRQLRRLLIPVPSPSEQCEIVHQIRTAKANVAAHRAKIGALQTVRMGLRRRLLHGAVNVNELLSA
jgi:type I restriction enzyme S subunit